MNRTSIGRQSYILVIVALAALIALLIRRDYLTRQLLVRTVNDLAEACRE